MSTHSVDVDLPDGAVVTDHVLVVAYMSPEDGSSHYWVRASDRSNMTTLLGLLSFAQHDLVEARNRGSAADG